MVVYFDMDEVVRTYTNLSQHKSTILANLRHYEAYRLINTEMRISLYLHCRLQCIKEVQFRFRHLCMFLYFAWYGITAVQICIIRIIGLSGTSIVHNIHKSIAETRRPTLVTLQQ